MHLRYLIATTALIALTAAGCADERPPIDRVQPDALEKSFFVGELLQDSSDDPEFYAQGTLVDVGFGATQDGLFTSTYAQPLSRVKWVVTEDLLIARATYERVADSDGKGLGPASTDGTVAAMYRIKSHFDISKAYNSTTGEELNIVQENTVDRPWYEREYFRVDWSKNLAVDSYDFDTLSLLGIYGGVEYEPLSYYVNDPTHEDAPHFDWDGGYFDVTYKAFAKPDEVDLSHFGWGIDSFPACWLENDFLSGSWPEGSCNPAELTIRQSFRRVESTDYEPVHWDGYQFQAFGPFYLERFGYSRNYGMSDDKWYRFPARYNIWERSHFYADPDNQEGAVECYTPHTTPFGEDPNRDLDGDGTEDECQVVGSGSKCDTFTQRCTLPFRERTPKPVAWYYTEKSDARYFDSTEWATHEWDVAMRGAVRAAQYAECVQSGDADCATEWPVYFGQQDENEDAINLAREVDDCRNGLAYSEHNRDRAACDGLADSIGAARGYSAGVISIAKMDEMVVLCHSPVEHLDAEACGDRRLPEGMGSADCVAPADAEVAATCDDALSVRRGDLRYHQVNVIYEPQSGSPWGIYTDAEDPLTGETVSASVNVWAQRSDRWAQSIVDQARYIHGELTTEEVTDGDNIKDWAEASRAAASGGIAPKLTKAAMDKRMAAFTKSTPERIANAQLDPSSPLMERFKAVKKQARGIKAHMGAPSSSAPIYAARRKMFEDTEFEASLMTPMMQQVYGMAGMPMSEALLDRASPLRGGNPSMRRDLYRMKELALADRGACVLDHQHDAPLGLTPLADLLQKKFGSFDPNQSAAEQQARAEKMVNYVAQRAHYSVIAHEMGHSIGMRHNFVSSSDALGYRPQYWQLRTKNGTVTEECTDLQKDGEGCVGPRYFDPMTDNERDNMIFAFMHSTVMDYAGEATQDMMGLGAYDFAAARMFYGETVAVLDDDSYKADQPRGDGMLAKMDSFGGIVGFSPEIGGEEFHYSQMQNNYALINDCADVDVQQYKPASWDEDALGAWDPVFDGKIVAVDGVYSRCKSQKVDYVPWNTLRFPSTAEVGNYYYGGPAIDAKSRVRVPFGFGTDGWADLGNLSVYRNDNGADPYELFNFIISRDEVSHIFSNFRRKRQDFSVRSQMNRSVYRMEQIRDASKGIGLLTNIYRQVARDDGYNFDQFWPEVAPIWYKENILASGMGFDHFARLAARPQSGDHFFLDGDPVLHSADDTWADATATSVVVPEGAQGFYGNVAFGGRLLQNKLSDDNGEYDSELVTNAGSYYEKVWTPMMLAESVDNYISSDRSDFFDPRYRSVSLADVFPDGYRRWLANNLTNDEEIKGPRVQTDESGMPLIDEDGFPSRPFGYTSWWREEVKSCFPGNQSTICSVYGNISEEPFEEKAPAFVAPIESQIGWEQQKFFLVWTYVYLPENQQQNWLDMLRVWELGMDSRPELNNRIEFHNPMGKVYVAQTFGKEEIFGKTVQKGVAARVLEYANGLLLEAYETTPGPDLDGDTEPDWYIADLGPDGQPVVRWDPTVRAIGPEGNFNPAGVAGCNRQDSSQCTCTANRACIKLESYVSMLAYMRNIFSLVSFRGLGFAGIY